MTYNDPTATMDLGEVARLFRAAERINRAFRRHGVCTIDGHTLERTRKTNKEWSYAIDGSPVTGDYGAAYAQFLAVVDLI